MTVTEFEPAARLGGALQFPRDPHAWIAAVSAWRPGTARLLDTSRPGDAFTTWTLFDDGRALGRVLRGADGFVAFVREDERRRPLWRAEVTQPQFLDALAQAGGARALLAALVQLRPPYELRYLRDWTGQPCYAYRVEGMWIGHPHLSECGRHAVDPLDYYGLTPQELAAQEAANGALRAGA